MGFIQAIIPLKNIFLCVNSIEVMEQTFYAMSWTFSCEPHVAQMILYHGFSDLPSAICKDPPWKQFSDPGLQHPKTWPKLA